MNAAMTFSTSVLDDTHVPHRPERLWPRIPHGLTFCGDANAVAVDSRDHVYVFNRGPIPILIFDAAGDHIGGWGTGEFNRPHSIVITDDDDVWLVDTGSHFIQKRDLDGNVLLTIGEPGHAAPDHSGEPFNGPTDVVVHPETGDVFISDGYFNSHIHKYDSKGRHIMSWGGTGDAPGEFTNPHGICLLGDDKIVVCDRENYRLQFFTLDGKFIDQWHAHLPSAIRTKSGLPNVYMAEMGPSMFYLRNRSTKLGNCVKVIAPNGDIVERMAGEGEFTCPHGLAIDSTGDVYIAEVCTAYLGYIGEPPPPAVEPVSLRKWRCVSAAG